MTLTDAVAKIGGVWTVDNFETKLRSIPSSDRKAAVYTQLQYNRKVLNAKGSGELFWKSKN